MKSNSTARLKVIVMIVFGFCITACTNNLVIIPETDYSAKIVGQWTGTVGNLKETMTIKNDCTFVCHVHPNGFIANTLSQGVRGTVNGTWKITGPIITLNITGEKKERLQNKIALSTIISLKENELALKSDIGETSLFKRVKHF